MKLHWRHWLASLCSLLLLACALLLLYRLTHDWHWHDIRHALWQSPPLALLLALLLTTLSYLCLTGYDWLATRQAGSRLPWRHIALTSFVAYTFSNTLGFALLTGSSVRYRCYSALGLSTGAIARVIVFCSTTFFLGLGSLGGISLLWGAGHPLLALMPSWSVPLFDVAGLLSLALVGGYLLWPHHTVRWRQYAWSLPRRGSRLLQLLLALLDWMTVAAVLLCLLPAGSVSYPALLAAFVLASLLGVIAHVPGGLGVFEAAMTLQLGSQLPTNQLLAALLLYRLIYYVCPFVLALLLFTLREFSQRPHWRSSLLRAREWLPALISLGAFAAGALLLCVGMVPTMHIRIEALLTLLPLPLLEVAHLLGSVSGVLLLLLARGLYRRYDTAFRITQGLLVAGMLFSLLRGGDWESALLLGGFLLLIAPCEPLFYRKGALLHAPFTPASLLAIGAVLLGAMWLLFFSYRHVEYDPALWLTVTPHGGASRGLRAMGSVVAVLAMVGMAQLLAPLHRAGESPSAAELALARQLVSGDGDIHGCLAQLGDKSLLFHPSGRAFVMYACEGGNWILMGDPVGDPALAEELLWQCREHCDEQDANLVVYQASPRYLPCYLELGLLPYKLGEEAIVDLTGFDLASSRLRNLRQSHAKGRREGLRFAVIEPEAVAPWLNELRAISDAWLLNKQGREKGFSVGYFDVHYLQSAPLALVWQGDRLVGFANVWSGQQRACLSVDLMRYLPEIGSSAVMDFLFVELLLWGKAQHYHTFNLGMAPMSGLRNHPLSGYWARLGNTLYRRGGRFYNFQGLHRYKEKFAPSWEPRYLLCASRLALPRILTQLVTLISRGPLGLLRK